MSARFTVLAVILPMRQANFPDLSMNKILNVLLSSLLVSLVAAASVRAGPGLPDGFEPDPSIPKPAEVLGFEPGAKHPRNDQIVAYLQALAAASEQVKVEITGHTHDGRPLVLVYFASPDLLQDLDSLRAGRKAASRSGDGPPVVWLGYSVHGNEASGASASVVTAWYLAASREPEVRQWLDQMVIVMHPVLNPDGLDRFAHWVNMHAGRNPSPDPADREHTEAWPSGRTNYYWFDLNRDWMPVVHPESRARMAQYHQWRPHVLTDHHEMGHEASYFFQPGVPERNNPLTPERNFELTGKLAEFHGAILDQAGEPHFTREMFDDYYVGKGSTYPDLTGGIGVLFEQGTARGHVMETPWGQRSFRDAVANQVRTSISTLRGSLALAGELIEYQAEFFRSAPQEARNDRLAGWVVGDDGDPARARELLGILLTHDIEIRPVTGPVRIEGTDYGPGSAWVIAAGQDHYRLLRSIFDEPTELPMDTFYDVSAWPLHRAFDLPLAALDRLPPAGDRLNQVPAWELPPAPDSDAAAWLVPWNQLRAPAVAAALLADGYRVQSATRPVTVGTGEGARELVRGSLVVHPGTQDHSLAPVGGRLHELAAKYGVQYLAAGRGLSASGIDLGSPAAPMLTAPKPAILTGAGLNANHAGYLWHWFDTVLDQPVTRLDWVHLYGGLNGYTHLILPDGEYGFIPEWLKLQLIAFIAQGGQVIAIRQAATWVEELALDWDFAADPARADEEGPAAEPPMPRKYGDFFDDFARQLIGGTALNLDLDTSHPLAFGYQRDRLVVFRRGIHRLKEVNDAYAHPGRYPENPVAAGFLSQENRQRLAGTPGLSATRLGPGLVVRMADDYVFRGYWRGSERLLANALFFGSLIGETELPQ